MLNSASFLLSTALCIGVLQADRIESLQTSLHKATSSLLMHGSGEAFSPPLGVLSVDLRALL